MSNRTIIARRLVALARLVMGFKDFAPARELGRMLELYARRNGLAFNDKGGAFRVLAEEGGYAVFKIEEDRQGEAVRYQLVGYDGELERGGKISIYHGNRLNRGWGQAVKAVLDRISRGKGI